MSTMIDEDTNMISSLPYEYEDGEEMKQIWHPEFIFFAYLIAIVSSYSAVHLLDHGLWRSDDLKKVAIIKNPDIVAACMLGFGTVWCMHFVSKISQNLFVIFVIKTAKPI